MPRAYLLAIWLAVPWVAQAQSPPEPPTAQDPPTFTSKQVSGEIQQWDPQTGQLVLAAEDDRTTLEMSDASTVFIDGRLGQATELSPGQSARAAFQEKDGVRVVRWIEVLGAGPKKSPSKTQVAPPTAPAFGSYEGRIASVDASAQSFVLASAGGPWELDLRDVVVIVEGHQSSIDTLPEGTLIRATWETNATPRTLRVEPVEQPAN